VGELHAYDASGGIEQLRCPLNCGRRILDVVKDTGEQDPAVGSLTLDLIRKPGDLVGEWAPPISEGVRLRGPRGQGHRLTVHVRAGDVVAGPGQLQCDVAEPGTDV
jgi:hypothetical protein